MVVWARADFGTEADVDAVDEGVDPVGETRFKYSPTNETTSADESWSQSPSVAITRNRRFDAEDGSDEVGKGSLRCVISGRDVT